MLTGTLAALVCPGLRSTAPAAPPKVGGPTVTPAGQPFVTSNRTLAPAAPFASALVTLTERVLVTTVVPAGMVTLSGLTAATTTSCNAGVAVGSGVGVGVSVGFGPGMLDMMVRLVDAARSPVGERLRFTAFPQALRVALVNESGAVHRKEKLMAPPLAAFGWL